MNTTKRIKSKLRFVSFCKYYNKYFMLNIFYFFPYCMNSIHFVHLYCS